MNDFIDLPHLPECLLGLPLETIHEIHSHTYHAIKADRQQRGEPVAVVDGDETGTWAEFVPGCDLVPGQELFTASQPAAPAQEPSAPDQALLISMATCLYHGFGLLDQGRQEAMLHDMRKLWDEVMGRGYYTPSNRERYISMLAAAPKFGEEQ